MKDSSGDENEMMQYKITPVNEVEPEERRMSDLSDWASSITSSVEVQVMELQKHYLVFGFCIIFDLIKRLSDANHI